MRTKKKNTFTPLRLDVMDVKKRLAIPGDSFRELPIDKWQEVEKKLIDNFTKLNYGKEKAFWLWEFYKQETFSFQCGYNYPFDQLLKLVNHDEQVWLMLNETVNEQPKYWYYEGYIETIVLILYESTQTDEVYIASKKYDWLMCINHHDVLIATGNYMPGKLRALQKTIAG
jgi:hypothetical protein